MCAKDEGVEMHDNESIDEIGFMVRDSGSRVQHDAVRTAEAPQSSAKKQYKRSVSSTSISEPKKKRVQSICQVTVTEFDPREC